AADEVARQLRLRDLAGLIVIDFIDMEAKKHNAMVERRMKEALKNDRARIQVGHISHFGLMEMSRQRLRPSLAETSFIACPHCGGTGHVRSTESAAIHVLRGIEDEGSKRRAAEIVVHVATPIALYLLNHKRERLQEIEARYAMRVIIAADDGQLASQFRIERVRAQIVGEALSVVTPDAPQPALPPPAAAVAESEADEDEAGEDEEDDAEEMRAEGDEPRGDGASEGGAKETPEEADRRRKRRRRRRRGRRDDMPGQGANGAAVEGSPVEGAPVEGTPVEGAPGESTPGDARPAERAVVGETADGAAPVQADAGEPARDTILPETHIEGVPEHTEPLTAAEEEARNRRRGRRGGRRRRREPGEGELTPVAELGAEQPDLLPVYTGPTPANPFGGHAFDIFDVLEQAERSAAATRTAPEPTRTAPAAEPERVAAAAPAQTPIVEPAEIVNASAPEPVAEAAEPAATGETPPVVVDAPIAEAAPAEAAPAEATARPAFEPSGEPAPEIANAGAPEPAAIEPLAPEPAVAEPEMAAPATAAPGATPDAAFSGPTDVGEAQPETAAAPEPAFVGPQATPVDAATPPVAANDATSEPAIKPIMIGSADAPPGEKKRGWWRR
ncbi:MAG: ribonuclease E/G, partial [Acetobacteraceae bacterium]|nr:ribonuclease E/G [Acetobacteraceae bacterium]